ncbi:glycerophosphodiester phosphodiesterase [Lysinibacillus contaminans]|uniref:Glycerophosphodiester phosphodiesterase n=1 Tax=Lysinibacillus contaminans TaxID=1293441 RepID=A0ABR5K1S0_9BACI|nr:glycerophosphodiester phosphodiesterase [Lysinibacillus contaminans]KOS68679.1 glycerophosphodiester phosphodiesterase [Lysinibacillus contaminans]
MQKARQIIKLAFKNIIVYRIDYIHVFALFRLFQFLFIVPVTSLAFKFMLRVTGYTHITDQNLYSFLMHPFVICMMLLWILIVLLFIYYEMGFLFVMAFNQQRGTRYRFLAIWQQLNRKAVYFFSFQTIYLAIYIALLLPLASFILPFTLTQEITIPHFIMDELMQTKTGRLFYAGVASMLVIFGVRSILTLPIFTIHPKLSIRQSLMQSWRFSKRRLFKLLVLLAMLLTGHLLLLLGITVISTLPLYYLERHWPSTALVTAGVTLAFLEIVFVVLFSLLQAMFSQVMVAITYNTLRLSKQKIAPNLLKKRYKQIFLLGGIVFGVMSVINIDSLEKSIYAPDTKIIAHRGYNEVGVENTISGLVNAANLGADLIELDIQQTADGEFVVFHDRTLRRLAGKNNTVANMTLSELTAVTIHANGFSDKITSLDDFIEMAKALDVALLIELKIHGKETEDILLRLVEKLRVHKVLDTYYVQSSNTEMITQLKNITPNLRVGIVYALNIGLIDDTKVDFIALEESSVSDRLIEELQQQDIDLFVWTLNNDRSLQEFIGKNVGGIITDHPTVALEIRSQQSEHEYFLQRVLNRLHFIFLKISW